MKTKHKNINEEINRMKSLFTEERLYGNLVEQDKIDYTKEVMDELENQADEQGNLNTNTIQKEPLLKKIGGTIKNIAQQVGTGVENFGEKVDSFMEKQSVNREANIEKKKGKKIGYVSGKEKRKMNKERDTEIDTQKEKTDKKTKSDNEKLQACKKGVSNYVNLFLSMSKKKRKTVAQVESARGSDNFDEDVRKITECLTDVKFKPKMEEWANNKYLSFGFGDGMPKEGILFLLNDILTGGNVDYLNTNIWAKSTADDGEEKEETPEVKPTGKVINVKEEGGAQRILGKIQPQTDGSFIIQGTPGIGFIYKKKLNDMYKLDIIKNLNNSGIKGDDIELIGKPKMKKNAYIFQFKLVGNDNINITNPNEA